MLKPTMSSDYYETLDINRTATDADIKKAYRSLALKFHPSTNTEAGSAEKFCQLGEAYDVLTDARTKAIYDRFGEEGLRAGAPPESDQDDVWSSQYIYHGNPGKTFRQFFGSDNPFAHLADGLMCKGVKMQDPPIERDLHLSLEDLFNGCTKKIKISRRFMNECGGTSSIKDKILTLDVIPGWHEGTRITFPKEGDQGPNCIPADIVFIVREKTHRLFVREHDDLIYKTQISLEMALTGFCVDIETLDGRLISIPINAIVHPTYKKVVTGEGMPLSQNASQRGNLIITFDTKFPKSLNPESKRLIKQALHV
ncbi:dnaJ homolog subfamily B member 13 [Genypterus blacodes]|uniref:dnaJ homolog subfamily B member 13 n=1 Tax=Genypterus blacodes TaxID=154954 RepID=UPI003F773AC0